MTLGALSVTALGWLSGILGAVVVVALLVSLSIVNVVLARTGGGPRSALASIAESLGAVAGNTDPVRVPGHALRSARIPVRLRLPGRDVLPRAGAVAALDRACASLTSGGAPLSAADGTAPDPSPRRTAIESIEEAGLAARAAGHALGGFVRRCSSAGYGFFARCRVCRVEVAVHRSSAGWSRTANLPECTARGPGTMGRQTAPRRGA